MVQKSFIAIVFTLLFTINTSMVDNISVGNKLGKIFYDGDTDQFQRLNPLLWETIALRMYRQRELAQLKNQLLERQETNDIREATGDLGNPTLQLFSDWMRREEMKRKRAHHRALCHFKICNMGSKRSTTWDIWPNDN